MGIKYIEILILGNDIHVVIQTWTLIYMFLRGHTVFVIAVKNISCEYNYTRQEVAPIREQSTEYLITTEPHDHRNKRQNIRVTSKL